jgi:hypothetical protein
LAKVENDIVVLDYKISEPVEVQLTEQEKNEYHNETRQVYSLILGQCTQLLQDKMKQESTWATVSRSYNPLQLYSLI